MPRAIKTTLKKEIVKKEAAVKTVTKPVIKKQSGVLSVPVYSLLGRQSGTMDLPKEIFGAKVNKTLLTQAIRVYSTNKKQFTASTKGRGQVHGTTAKAYRQKGTGRARHGAKTAPIFVGGGVAFGPNPRKVELSLPKKMKKAALISALSEKLVEQKIVGITGIEKANGKTKEMAKFFTSLNTKSALIVLGEKNDLAIRAVKNIKHLDILPANMLNAYEVSVYNSLVFTKDALEKLKG